MPAGEKQQLMTLIKFQLPHHHISSLSFLIYLFFLSVIWHAALATQHLSLWSGCSISFLPSWLCGKINISSYQLAPLIHCEIQCFWGKQSLEDTTQQPLAKPLAVATAATVASWSITTHSLERGLGILWSPSLGFPVKCCHRVRGSIDWAGSNVEDKFLIHQDVTVTGTLTWNLDKKVKCTF